MPDDLHWFYSLPASIRMDITCVVFNRLGHKAVPLEELAEFSRTTEAAWRKRACESLAILRARLAEQGITHDTARQLETAELAAESGCTAAANLLLNQSL